MNERVVLNTADGISIIGDYYEGGSDRAVLLLHMMPATRASWTAFANQLVESSFSAFAIDLRGHGESIAGPEGKILDYKEFQDADHGRSIEDLDAAVAYLRETRGMKHIAIAGASIGANLAYVYAAAHPEIGSIVLLSPGLTYHGVNAQKATQNFTVTQRAYFMASADDEYSAASTKELYEAFPGEKEFQLFDDAGHGTTMLERKPEFLKTLAEWLGRS